MLQDGMGTILNEINKIENSNKKSYEVCKNITVYSQDSDSSGDDGEYMGTITKVLRKIVTETREILESSFVQIDKIYITGLGTAINNIDLYFQEYISTVKCEILKPFFAESGSVKVPIKEYIEVNSAIALALNGLGFLNKDLNFTGSVQLSLDTDVGELFRQIKSIRLSGGSGGTSSPLDKSEKFYVRLIVCALIVLVTYIGFCKYSLKTIEKKQSEVADAHTDVMIELQKIQNDIDKVNTEAEAYEMSLETLKKLADEMNGTEENRVIEQLAIPKFLNRTMSIIPKDVRLTSIRNSANITMQIVAEAEEYEQLGYFMSALRTLLVNSLLYN